jgi:hypothetical protein
VKLSSKIFTRLRPVGDWKILYRSLLNQSDNTQTKTIDERSSKSAPKGMMTSGAKKPRWERILAAAKEDVDTYSPISEDWSYSCNCHRCLTSCLGIAPASQSSLKW